MAKRGDGEIMGQSDNGSRGVPVPPVSMEVGASLSDMLLGNQRKTGGKPLSLDTADSELLAAVIGGRMDEVNGRILGSGMSVDEGTQVLIVKAREKKAEESFIESLLTTAAAIATEVAKAKDMQNFQAERQQVQNYDAQQEKRAQDRDSKQVDLFGGYLLGDAYVDKFGGTYTDYGYRDADGSFTMISGDRYDAKSQQFMLQDGGPPIKLASILAEFKEAPEAILVTASQLQQRIKLADESIDFAKEFYAKGGSHQMLQQLVDALEANEGKVGKLKEIGKEALEILHKMDADPRLQPLVEELLTNKKMAFMIDGLISSSAHGLTRMGSFLGQMIRSVTGAPAAVAASAVVEAPKSTFTDMGARTETKPEAPVVDEKPAPRGIVSLATDTSFLQKAQETKGGGLAVMQAEATEDKKAPLKREVVESVHGGLADRVEKAQKAGQAVKILNEVKAVSDELLGEHVEGGVKAKINGVLERQAAVNLAMARVKKYDASVNAIRQGRKGYAMSGFDAVAGKVDETPEPVVPVLKTTADVAKKAVQLSLNKRV